MGGGGGGVKTNLKARAVIKEQEREKSRFVQQKCHYWSKYCLKRSVFRLVLKVGRGGKGREFHMWTAEKQKARPKIQTPKKLKRTLFITTKYNSTFSW